MQHSFWLAVVVLICVYGGRPPIYPVAAAEEQEREDDNSPLLLAERWGGHDGGHGDDDEEEDGSWLRCKWKKVLICHHPDGKGKAFELCVPAKSVGAHQAHGDTLGPCPPKIIPCPETCDDLCPSACGNLTGGAGENCTDGISCWDLNENGQCDVPEEDKNDDQMCTPLDCQGAPGTNGTDGEDGIDCWDLNANGQCDLPSEDKNDDQMCTPLDCQGEPGSNGTCPNGGGGGGPLNCTLPEAVKVCCYISVAGDIPPDSNFPVMGEIIWPAWNDCTLTVNGFLPCLGQFENNPDLCALILDKYGPGNSTRCTLPDFTGMKIPQYMM